MSRGVVAASKGETLDGEADAFVNLPGVGVGLGTEDGEVAELPEWAESRLVFGAVVDLEGSQWLPEQSEALGLLKGDLLEDEVVAACLLVVRQVGGGFEGDVDGSKEGWLVAVLGMATGEGLPAEPLGLRPACLRK